MQRSYNLESSTQIDVFSTPIDGEPVLIKRVWDKQTDDVRFFWLDIDAKFEQTSFIFECNIRYAEENGGKKEDLLNAFFHVLEKYI